MSINVLEKLPICPVLDCPDNKGGQCSDLVKPQKIGCMLNEIQKVIDKSGAKVQSITVTKAIPKQSKEIEIDERSTSMSDVGLQAKLKAHLWTLPRWFAAPFFGSALIAGVLIATTSELRWQHGLLALIGGLCVMAGGHSFNSYLDYAWTKLDVGEKEDRSAEKDYCGGQNLIENRIVSIHEVLANAIFWYALSAIPIMYLAFKVGVGIAFVWLAGMLVTFWYSQSKFNWTHELALGTGVGPVAVLMGMYGVNAHPDFIRGILISWPFAIMLSFAGLALDEWPDAEANIAKGVKSFAFKVWEMAPWAISSRIKAEKDVGILRWYLISWILFMQVYHVLMITIGYLAPLSALAFITFYPMMACLIFLQRDFRKAAGVFVAIAALYPVLLVVGQVLG